MGGFGSNPPPVPDVPDVPVPSFSDITKQIVPTMKDAGWFDDLIASLTTAVMPTLTNFIALAASGLDDLISLAVHLLSAFQGINTPGFFTFIAAMLEDTLAVPVSATAMQSSFQSGGQMGAMRTVGAALFDLLATEFAGGSTVTPESGLAGAKAFLGYMLSFSVREANVATLVSLLPESMRFLEGIREYPVSMARNIGLGRLVRRAIQPLVQVLVADPLTKYLNNQYRPTWPAEGLAVKAAIRGNISSDTLSYTLSHLGYTDAWQAAIQADAWERPGITELYTLERYGEFPNSTTMQQLQNRGTSAQLANWEYDAERFKEADAEISGFISELRTQRVQGYIDAATFASILDTLPIGALRAQWIKDLIGQQVEFPRIHISLAEAQSGFLAGILDLNQLSAVLVRLGYSDDDQNTLTELTLLKLGSDAYKVAKAQYDYNKAKSTAIKKGLPVPPAPPGVNP